MNNKVIKVAIIGLGSRGCECYGNIMLGLKDKFEIVSLCDIKEDKLERSKKLFEVEDSNCFLSDEEFLKAKRADALIIATPDDCHVRHCKKALELGYDILLEKPLTDKKEECIDLLATQKKYGGKVVVCHVLRYASSFTKVDELINEGTIGRLVSIQAIEQVHYWHQAHSYVRGNWRKRSESTPMILAKCCHDLDLLQYYAKSRCKSVSSIGELSFFKEENAPVGSASRCTKCKYMNTCPYSAKRIYIDMWKKEGCQENTWPMNVISLARPLTEESLMKAIEEGPYGRCVFRCDNDVVDNQSVQMEFENGVKATLTMMAFTGNAGRVYKFYGTIGEIDLDEERGLIHIKKFGEDEVSLNINDLVTINGGHGGGDDGLIKTWYEILVGNNTHYTSLEASIESHLMGIASEESRLSGGKLIYLHEGEGHGN